MHLSLSPTTASANPSAGEENPSSVSLDATSDDRTCPNLEGQTLPESAPDLFLVEAFRKADNDGDGKLSYGELKDVLQSLGLEEDEEKLNKIVLAVDTDNDGTIDLAEFQFIIDKMNTKTTMSFEQQLREMFELYDVDGSGTIDQAELAQLMATLGYDLTDEELLAMIAELDADGSGDIDYEEFKKMYKCIAVPGDEKDEEKEKKGRDAVLRRQKRERRLSILGGSIFDDAKQLMSFGSAFRFVTWLYSKRKMILLCCSHFVATMVIWGECTHILNCLANSK